MFTGEFPRELPYSLPPTAAQATMDCDFTRGILTGLRERAPVAGVNAPGAKSIFVYDGLTYSYFTWNRDVDAVRGPVPTDEFARFYWTDGTGFYVSRGDIGSGAEPSESNRFQVGVPQPKSEATLDGNTNAFNVSGLRPTAATLYCERSDGSTFQGLAISMIPSENGLRRWKMTINANFACSLDQSTPSANVTGPMLKVEFSDGLGAHAYAYLRATENNSTFDPALAQITGSITATAGKVEVNLETLSDYTEARAYTYTYVNQYGEEGPPSLPVSVDVGDGQVVRLRYVPPPVNHPYIPISRIRWYRASVSGSYAFVAEHTVNQNNPTFVDDVSTGALGEALSTNDFFPPEQNLRGLCRMPNGVLAAFKDNEVHFSVPYLPYAWKSYTIQTTETRVVDICPFESGLYVVTTAHPVIVTGVDPDSMTMQKIPAVQAGVSKGCMTNVGPYVAYASHDGIVVLRGLDASLELSLKFFTRDVWQDLFRNQLSQMRLDSHNGYILVWFADGTPGFLVRLDESQPSLTKLSQAIYSATQHPQADSLYVGSGNGIYSFAADTKRLPFQYWTKDFVEAYPGNYGCVQLVGTGSVQLITLADGVVKDTKSVSMDDTGRTVVRLPGGFLARRWSFKINGEANASVQEFTVAHSPMELRGG